jgi:predicted GTPase
VNENVTSTSPVSPDAPVLRASRGQGRSAGTAPAANDPEALRFYTKAKLALAVQLRALRETIQRSGDKTRLQQCDDLMVKLAEDRFTLAVLGQFKRGKSSLMNAIIGRELLPVGVLPLTSAITVLRFGPRERLLITRSDVKLAFPEEYPVERLPEFVTEKENPGNRKHVKTATIELPVPFLRRGLEFVDTPGVGSAIEANTITTLKFLPECDAVLFVTSVDSPVTRLELEFLQSIRQHVRKVFFVVNKMDLLATHERSAVLDYVRHAILKQTGRHDAKVFPVSARVGLLAELEGGWSDGLESGLTELENALARFLSGERATVFLAAVADRALWLCEQQSMDTRLRQRANELPEKEWLERLSILAGKLAGRKAERRQLFERLRQRVLAEAPAVLMPELRAVLRSETEALPSRLDRLLNGANWLPLGWVLRRTEQALAGQVCGNIGTWLQSHSGRLNFVSDEPAKRDWERIQSTLSEMPAMAAEVFGFPRAPKAKEGEGRETESWRLSTKLDAAFVPMLSWRLRIPGPWKILPLFLVRKSLRSRMQRDGERLADELQRAAIQFATEAVSSALGEREKEVEKRAAEIGSRVLESVDKVPRPSMANHSEDAPASEAAAELPMIHDRLLALRGEIAPLETLPEEPETLTPLVSASARPSARSPRGLPDAESATPDLGRDLQTRDCPVCDYLSQLAFGFFAHYQYALARDEGTQDEFAELLGFCALHTWQLEAVSSPVGASIGFAKLSERVSRLLAARAKAPLAGHGPVKLVRDSPECHVCRLLREKEREYLQRLADFVKTPDGHSAYSRSQGVCLRHLGLWLPLLSGADERFVLEEASRRFEQISEEMQSFSLKTEALRRHLRNTDEGDAWLRAITHLAGGKANCQPMNKEAAEI